MFAGYMLIHLVSLQCVVTLVSYLCPGRLSAGLLSAVTVLTLSLVSGVPLHRWDIPHYLSHLGVASPVRWLLPTLVAKEYSENALAASSGQHICRKNQVCDTLIIYVLEFLIKREIEALLFSIKRLTFSIINQN